MKSIYVRLIIAVLFSIGTMNFINTNPNIFNSMIGTIGVMIACLIDMILTGSAIASVILKYKK
ncbi:MAG: hypothetical protein O7C56_01795 [Rickettsia endosymbiont of Ixodes persulcatus]|nr:hypothetical protein [Rickettsia endosymbiont of Ixodes persulcatus]